MKADTKPAQLVGENATQRPVREADGTIRVPAFHLPLSSLLDTQTKNHYRKQLQQEETRIVQLRSQCPGSWLDREIIPSVRRFFDTRVYPEIIEKLRTMYDVNIQSNVINGVYTEVFMPFSGVAAHNASRVLINLHGGGFTIGSRLGGQIESIPVAALGSIRVISIDYRMAPEYEFPAATNDVVAVYKKLLEEHAPRDIGIYGCSAGGLLTAQTIARLQTEGVPLPAAVGMFCAAGGDWAEGDSSCFNGAMIGGSLKSFRKHPYFENANLQDPLVAPVHSPLVLSKFPPSLLIAATRDFALSSVVHMHSKLVASGVEAELHVWEGLQHGFFCEAPGLQQSSEVHRVAVKFFDRHLGRG